MCLHVCVCVSRPASKFLKVEKTLCPCLLLSLCSSALTAFQSRPGWLRRSHRVGEGRAACDWREAKEIQDTQHKMHTCRRRGSISRLQHRGRLQRDPTVAEQANRGGLGPREMIEPADEGGKLQTTSRMKRERERRTSRRPQHCLAYEPLH